METETTPTAPSLPLAERSEAQTLTGAPDPAEPLTSYVVERQGPVYLPPARQYGPSRESRAYRPHTGHGKAASAGRPLRHIGLAIVVVLVVVIGYYYLWAPRVLSRNLSRRGWVLFTRQGCNYCTQQLRILGDPFYSQTVVCSGSDPLERSSSINPAALELTCSQIPAFPYWYNTATKDTRTGLQDRRKLEQMADQ